MLELPEVLTLSKQLNEHVAGRRIEAVYLPTKIHKFCFFEPEPALFEKRIGGARIERAEGFGIFAEIVFDNSLRLSVDDGINLRLLRDDEVPKDYQLRLALDDGRNLVFTVSMYGGISVHEEDYFNKYYIASRESVSPFSEGFDAVYHERLAESKPNLTAKAFLATEQRFPGIANGSLQDILFAARIHPKRKVATLTADERAGLLEAIKEVLGEMTRLGGRDTEKDLLGNPGGYRTVMSKNTAFAPCAVCGTPIVKENYMGGSVYFCPECQRN
ncbi:MAG: endonuclease VIII [Clostridiales bacterium]|nr:endonuclease VIII [Clostridiales bacterium]